MNKSTNRKAVGVTAVLSSLALEIASIVTILPVKYYKEQYKKCKLDFTNKNRKKFLNSTYSDVQKEVLKTWRDRMTDTRIQALVLGATAVLLAVIGVKMQKGILEDVQKLMVDAPETIDNIASQFKIAKESEQPADTNEETAEPVQSITTWKCDSCGYENDIEKKSCGYCGALRMDIRSNVKW